ncbi:MAG: hypothetical protein ABL949_02290 [Fimbriimonadaceae bacterium]
MQYLKFFVWFGAVLASASINAQWVFTNLHSGSGTEESIVVGLSQSFQAGKLGDPSLSGGGVTWRGSASSVASLIPPGYGSCIVRGVAGNTVYGDAYNGVSRATYWPGGQPSAFVDLHPFGVTGQSRCYSGSEICQVGSARDLPQADYRFAAMWYGSSASYVRLHPIWATFSVAMATSDSRQFGWTSSPASFGLHRATVWEGTKESATVVHPAWAGTSASEIWSAAPGIQVGFVGNSSADYRACAWVDGQQTPINLTPSWAEYSQAAAVYGDKIVGVAVTPGGLGKAVLWHGPDPNACEDLSTYIPLPTDSVARSVFVDDSGLFIGGFTTNPGPRAFLLYKPNTPTIANLDPPYGVCSASNIILGVTGQNLGGGSKVCFNGLPLDTTVTPNGLTAILPPALQTQATHGQIQVKNGSIVSNTLLFELRQIVSPSTATIVVGTGLGGGLPEVLLRDDQYLGVRPSFVGSRNDPNIVVENSFAVSNSNPSSVILTYEASASSNPNTIALQAFDYQANTWVTLTTVPSNPIDTDVQVVINNPSRFVQSGALRSRFTLKSDRNNTSRSWQANIDFVSLEIRP